MLLAAVVAEGPLAACTAAMTPPFAGVENDAAAFSRSTRRCLSSSANSSATTEIKSGADLIAARPGDSDELRPLVGSEAAAGSRALAGALLTLRASMRLSFSSDCKARCCCACSSLLCTPMSAEGH